jgi:hypothetical protein
MRTEPPEGGTVTAQRAERSAAIPVIAALAGLLVFAGLTVWYVSWSVQASQHRWCAVIDLLNAAPPPAGSPQRNPARAYDQKLSRDFRDLKGSLGC